MTARTKNDRSYRTLEDGPPSFSPSSIPSLAAADVAPAAIPIGTGIGALNIQASRNMAAITAEVSDAQVANQWHLGFLGDLATLWTEYTGKSVNYGIYDSGVDTRLSAFAGSYDAGKEMTIDGKRYQGDYRPAAGAHGTAVAGLIGANRDGKDTIGIAYDSKLTSVNIFDPYSGGKTDPGIFVNADDPTAFYKAIAGSNRFDVTNHSWGTSDFTHSLNANRLYEGSFAYNFAEAVEFATETGRGGLGTITVKAAGNSGLNIERDYRLAPIDVAADSGATDRHITLVGAYREVDGNASGYSNRGAGLLIAAPSNDYVQLGGTGVWTTDVQGRLGYNTTDDPGGDLDYTDSFGGTSAATPIVSGVIGLMLDANPNLGWRDVKTIIAASAKMPVAYETGPTTITLGSTTYNMNESRFQLTGDGASSTVNGGGYHFSTDYGYGAIDAFGATRMAEVWNLFGDAQASGNEAHVRRSRSFDTLVADAYYDDAGRLMAGTESVFTIAVKDSIDVEHVDLTLSYEGDNPVLSNTNNFSITLVSPDGTSYVMSSTAFGETFGEAGTIGREVFGLAGYRGELSAGTWTVKIADLSPGDQSIVRGVALDIYGAASTVDSVHHYTDEFQTMTAIAGEGGRAIIADRDGGNDWLDFSASTRYVSLDMNAGGAVRFNGTDVATLDRKAKIENVVMGDGFDTVYGNKFDNHILGMRGSDELYGAKGNDFLVGGEGYDYLTGGSGQDVFYFDTKQRVDQDIITDFSTSDLLATTERYDTNGVIKLTEVFGNGVLRFDNEQFGDRVTFNRIGAASLYLVGERDGVFYYSRSRDTTIANAIALGDGPLDSTPLYEPDTHKAPTESFKGFTPSAFADAATSASSAAMEISTGDGAGQGALGPVAVHAGTLSRMSATSDHHMMQYL